VLPHDGDPETVRGGEEPAAPAGFLVCDGRAFEVNFDGEGLRHAEGRCAGCEDGFGFVGCEGVEGEAVLLRRGGYQHCAFAHGDKLGIE